AFNENKPYDQFIKEQLAGDELDNPTSDSLTATGFVRLGPRVLDRDLENPNYRFDYMDDMARTTFATFQGLTVNCARCHDHKFDPIPTHDYYRLTAVFNGAGFGERETATREQRAAREAAVAPIKKELDAVRRKLARIEDPVRTR